MKLRCCVCDMDGTVLNSANLIDPEVKDALLALRDRGVKLVLATGRTEFQIREYVSVLGIDTPTITCNGGMIKDPCTDEVLDVKFFKPSMAEAIVFYCLKNELDFLLYTTEYVYHSPNSKRILKFSNYNKTVAEEFRVPIRHIEELPKDRPFDRIIKVLIMNDLAILPMLEDVFNKERTLSIVSSGDRLIDIMPGRDTSKGNAVKRVCEILGIPLENTAVFGDSPNDESMFRVAGYAVCMGNACEELKKSADFVTTTNDEFGVKVGLEHIFSLETE